MKTKAFLALLVLFCIFRPALAQDKPAVQPQPQKTSDDKDDDIVKITTNLVQVDAVVTKDGKRVPNLTIDDFEIYEDGRKQTITSFAYISNVRSTASPAKVKATDAVPFTPLKRDDPRRTLALVVDDLGLSAESMHQVRRQLRKFVAEELQPNDLVAIIRTSGQLGALQQFTNDKRLLNRAVDQLRWNLRSRAGVSVIPRITSDVFENRDDELNYGGGSMHLTLRALRFIVDAMGQLPGRKSLVLLSDSMPRESQDLNLTENSAPVFPNSISYGSLLQRVAEKAIRASVVIYSVDTQSLQPTGITAADQVTMTRENMNTVTSRILSARSNMLWRRREGGELIAQQTGGFQVRNSNDFKLDRILEDQSGYYLLGYRPSDETFNRRFHHIKAKVKRSGLALRTRYGFFGVSEEEAGPNPLSRRDVTNLALASPFRAEDIEINLTSFFTDDKAAGSIVRSFLYIDAKGLKFDALEGRRQASIEVHGVLFGDNGVVVEQFSRGATLSLNESDFEHAMRNGMALPVDMTVKRPGVYQVRMAVRDRASSKIGSAGQFVAVPNLKNKKLAVSGIVLPTVPRVAGTGGDLNQLIETPGARSFDPNSNLYFAFVIYNATSANNLVMEATLFRDGKNVYSGPEVPINTGKQPDANRLLVDGSVHLSPDLEAGNYYLQVVITDKSAKKPAPVLQWIDFEIVK